MAESIGLNSFFSKNTYLPQQTRRAEFCTIKTGFSIQVTENLSEKGQNQQENRL